MRYHEGITHDTYCPALWNLPGFLLRVMYCHELSCSVSFLVPCHKSVLVPASANPPCLHLVCCMEKSTTSKAEHV